MDYCRLSFIVALSALGLAASNIHGAPAVDELGRWERNGSHVEGD